MVKDAGNCPATSGRVTFHLPQLYTINESSSFAIIKRRADVNMEVKKASNFNKSFSKRNWGRVIINIIMHIAKQKMKFLSRTFSQNFNCGT